MKTKRTIKLDEVKAILAQGGDVTVYANSLLYRVTVTRFGDYRIVTQGHVIGLNEAEADSYEFFVMEDATETTETTETKWQKIGRDWIRQYSDGKVVISIIENKIWTSNAQHLKTLGQFSSVSEAQAHFDRIYCKRNQWRAKYEKALGQAEAVERFDDAVQFAGRHSESTFGKLALPVLLLDGYYTCKRNGVKTCITVTR